MKQQNNHLIRIKILTNRKRDKGVFHEKNYENVTQRLEESYYLWNYNYIYYCLDLTIGPANPTCQAQETTLTKERMVVHLVFN